jgi:hypothetical protein
MSYRLKMILPVVGMFLLFGYVALAVVRSRTDEIKLPLPPFLHDLAAVRLVEIRDAGGQVVLSGNFTTMTEKDGDLEGETPLTATGVDADAVGRAEVEVSTVKYGAVDKELEVSVRDLAPGTTFNLFVDGQQAASFTTDQRGAAELEMTNSPSR